MNVPILSFLAVCVQRWMNRGDKKRIFKPLRQSLVVFWEILWGLGGLLLLCLRHGMNCWGRLLSLSLSLFSRIEKKGERAVVV